MHIIQFIHPEFLPSQSMPRFARMIADGMRERGHTVDVWTASPFFFNLPLPASLKKWMGYIDQYVVFPLVTRVRLRVRRFPRDSVFVFSDQALGPWVPLVKNKAHAIHVHDFMALRSALGEFPQNVTGWTGRQYQALIRRGFEHGECFISVSRKTRSDLHRFLQRRARLSGVVYNGLSYPFRPMSASECEAALIPAGLTLPPEGFLLHVGGNQWYKNREGVLETYLAYVEQAVSPLPLWMIGSSPTELLKGLADRVKSKGSVRFITGLSDEQVCAAYSSARLLVFPSLAEGFGWPIAEAMACGCLVLTTGEAPMTEVGGDAAFYMAVRSEERKSIWAADAARYAQEILSMPPAAVFDRQRLGFSQIAQFDPEHTLDAYERSYQEAMTTILP